MSRVSVVIPSYNHESYVAQSIQSVLAQSYQDFEIVVVDDASRDSTADVIRSFDDPRIKLFRHRHNLGASAAMNRCVLEAHGEFIAVLNSDDLFLPNKLERQVSFLERNREVGAVFAYPQLIDEQGQGVGQRGHPYSKVFRQENRGRFEWLRHFFYEGNALCHPTVLIRRSCYDKVGLYDERLAQLPDFDMWIRLCLEHEIAVLPEELIRFRVHSSEANASGARPDARIRLAVEHAEVLKNYLNIRGVERVHRVFPEAKQYAETFDEDLIPFVIAMCALHKGSTAHHLFAISTLFDLLVQQDLGERLYRQFGFAMSDFIQLTGAHDLLGVELHSQLQQRERELSQVQGTLEARQQELDAVYASLGWKTVSWCRDLIDRMLPASSGRRRAYDRVLRGVRVIVHEGWGSFFRRLWNQTYGAIWNRDVRYRFWVLKHEPSRAKLRAMQKESTAWSYRPTVSIVTPVYNPTEQDLRQCLQSVLDQIYDNWELCLVDGGSDKPHVREVIKEFSERDGRIKAVTLTKNLGIAGNSNEALRLATGEFVAFLDHDDMLAPFALYEVVKLLNQDRRIDVMYSDEDKVPSTGNKRYSAFFKPDWSPDTELSYNYLCHFAVIRRSVVEQVGGFREGYDGSQDYDLILRMTEVTSRIRRIPKILYHWRASATSVAADPGVKPYAFLAGKKAIQDHLTRRGLAADVVDGQVPGTYRVKYRVLPHQRVSIVIPTKDKVGLLQRCVSSILSKTDHRSFEVVIIDNQSEEAETHKFFEEATRDPRVKVLRYDHPFNFSAINNFGVRSTDSMYVLFLNNDTEVIDPGWLTAMIEFAQRKDVGAVGAKLYYPDDTVQHGGVVIGQGGVAGHSFSRFPRVNQGDMGRLGIVRNVSAVTGACLLIRREVFDEVGGFDERLSHAFNDIDLCLRIREKGYVIVWTPYAELYHHESASRGYDTETPERRARFSSEVELMRTRWKAVIDGGDPYYNPNLTLEGPDFRLKL